MSREETIVAFNKMTDSELTSTAKELRFEYARDFQRGLDARETGWAATQAEKILTARRFHRLTLWGLGIAGVFIVWRTVK